VQWDAQAFAEETAALRREAAEILSRSPWYQVECRREMLLRRRWQGPTGPVPLD
jgi:hypothetical protein